MEVRGIFIRICPGNGMRFIDNIFASFLVES